jgi:hypothetical protein
MLGPRGTARRPGGLLNGYREESARAPRHALMPMCQSTAGGEGWNGVCIWQGQFGKRVHVVLGLLSVMCLDPQQPWTVLS